MAFIAKKKASQAPKPKVQKKLLPVSTVLVIVEKLVLIVCVNDFVVLCLRSVQPATNSGRKLHGQY